MNFIDVDVKKDGSDYFVKTSNFTVKMPKDNQEKMAKYNGKKVTFGFRPEDLIDEAIAKDKAGRLIKSKVEVIEPLGSEIFLYLSSGTDNFVARVPHQYRTQIGAEVGFAIDTSKSHLFDIDTEEAIF
jgi:multiple sugar transport system ATP-binding protein